MSMRFRLGLAVVVCAFAMPADAELIVHKDLSYDIARTMAEGAIADCKARGYGVSVVVVGRDGETIVAMRGDGASPHTMENARRKAYTARSFKQPTKDYAKKLNEGNTVIRQQVTLPNVIAIPGGIPIKVDNDVIGGIGASGSPGVDDECVEAGIAKVQDQLK
jgi:uncharacterized protein GlcG (DUF336 family)